MKKKLSKGVVRDVYAFDRVERTLTHLGGVREDSVKLPAKAGTVMLSGGIPLQLSSVIDGALELLETTVGNFQAWNGMLFDNCDLWFVLDTRTVIVRGIHFTIDPDNVQSDSKLNSAKLSVKGSHPDYSDLCYVMSGKYDPQQLAFLFNPELQKILGTTEILDASSYRRKITASGISAGTFWYQDKVSGLFDGVNDYLSCADSEFRGPEKLGLFDSNNRNFETGIGNWTKQNANDTFASAAGGQSGNGGKLTVGAGASTTFMKLPSDIGSLVVGESYHLQLQLKYETAWSGSYVNIALGGASKRILPTTNYQLFSFDFIANTVNPEIVMSALSGLTAGNILWIDEVSLTTTSQANLNFGERIFSATSREFEGATTGNWTNNGNHSVIGGGAGRNGGSDASITIVSSGAGNQSTNFESLSATYFRALVSGKKYTVEFWAKLGTAGINVTAAFGASGQTKLFTGLSTSVWTKCVFNLIAGANDVSQSLRLYLSATDATGVLIDDVSLTEAFDVTVVAWVKRNGNPSSDERIVSKFNSTQAGYLTAVKNADDKFLATLRDDTNAVTVNGSTTVITDNVYHLVVATISRTGNIQLYVDAGVDNGNSSVAAIGKILTANAVVVAADAAPSGYFNGQIAACFVKPGVAWTLSQVLEYYNSVKQVYR